MNNRELKTIIKLFESSELSSMKLEKDDIKIELHKKTADSVAVQPNQTTIHEVKQKEAPTTAQPEREINTNTLVKAPLVGTYYEAPAPDQPAFVRVGQSVKKGETLCIIEAMKVMNEISAPVTGKVVDIQVENGDMVMYDQILMEIE